MQKDERLETTRLVLERQLHEGIVEKCTNAICLKHTNDIPGWLIFIGEYMRACSHRFQVPNLAAIEKPYDMRVNIMRGYGIIRAAYLEELKRRQLSTYGL